MEKITTDFRQEVTNQIIELLETTEKHKNPWLFIKGGSPMNPFSLNEYSGINFLTLSITANIRNYEHNKWLTFKQISALNGKITKGAKGAKVFYYDKMEKTNALNETETVKFMKMYTVFNVSCIENLPAEYYKINNLPDVPFWETEEIADELINNSGAKITHKAQNEAYYNITRDEIILPILAQFDSPTPYYNTVFHELIHWTGHSSRLDRFKTKTKEDYAFEELVAELGAVFLCAKLGFKLEMTQNAIYIASWLKGLKSDKTFIFSAAAKAQQASNFIINNDNNKTLAFVA